MILSKPNLNALTILLLLRPSPSFHRVPRGAEWNAVRTVVVRLVLPDPGYRCYRHRGRLLTRLVPLKSNSNKKEDMISDRKNNLLIFNCYQDPVWLYMQSQISLKSIFIIFAKAMSCVFNVFMSLFEGLLKNTIHPERICYQFKASRGFLFKHVENSLGMKNASNVVRP